MAVMAGVASPSPSFVAAQVDGPSSPMPDIYQLQAAFRRAKTMQDIDLMMSLWADDATFNQQGGPNSPYVGPDNCVRSGRALAWLGFTNRRLSLVPSFKIQIDVESGDEGWP
jgi:hypothetical protein